MKKKLLLIIGLAAFSFIELTNAQTFPFLQNFDTCTAFRPPYFWSYSTAPFNIYPTHGVGGSQALSRELSSFSITDSIISPLIGPITTSAEFSFDYRIVNYIGSTPVAYNLVAGDKIEIKIIFGGNTSTALTIDPGNHINNSAFAGKSVNLSSYTGGSINIMIKITGTTDDFFVDIDNFNVQNITSVNQVNKNKNYILLFPNPVSELLNISSEQSCRIKIFNSQGQLMAEEKIAEPIKTLPVKNFPAGLYFVELLFEDHSSVIKTFLRQ